MRQKLTLDNGGEFAINISSRAKYFILREATGNILFGNENKSFIELSRSDVLDIELYRAERVVLKNTTGDVITIEFQITDTYLSIKEQRNSTNNGIVVDEVKTPVTVSKIIEPVYVRVEHTRTLPVEVEGGVRLDSSAHANTPGVITYDTPQQETMAFTVRATEDFMWWGFDLSQGNLEELVKWYGKPYPQPNDNYPPARPCMFTIPPIDVPANFMNGVTRSRINVNQPARHHHTPRSITIQASPNNKGDIKYGAITLPPGAVYSGDVLLTDVSWSLLKVGDRGSSCLYQTRFEFECKGDELNINLYFGQQPLSQEAYTV